MWWEIIFPTISFLIRKFSKKLCHCIKYCYHQVSLRLSLSNSVFFLIESVIFGFPGVAISLQLIIRWHLQTRETFRYCNFSYTILQMKLFQLIRLRCTWLQKCCFEVFEFSPKKCYLILRKLFITRVRTWWKSF